MILLRNISFEHFDKLSLDGIMPFVVTLAAIQLKECPENGL